MAGTSQLRGREAQDAHVADLERAAYPTAVPRAAGEGLVERFRLCGVSFTRDSNEILSVEASRWAASRERTIG